MFNHVQICLNLFLKMELSWIFFKIKYNNFAKVIGNIWHYLRIPRIRWRYNQQWDRQASPWHWHAVLVLGVWNANGFDVIQKIPQTLAVSLYWLCIDAINNYHSRGSMVGSVSKLLGWQNNLQKVHTISEINTTRLLLW